MHDNDDKQIRALAQRILTKAGWKLGGGSLAKHLGVSDSTLSDWLSGKTLPPGPAILRAVQLLEDTSVTGVTDTRTATPPE